MPSLSIRYAIPLLIVTPIVASVGLTGLFAYRNGHRAVAELTIELSDKATTTIEEHIKSYLDQPRLVEQLLAANVESGVLTLSNEDELRQTFWRITRDFEFAQFTYYGNEQGNFWGVDRRRSELGVLWRRTAASAPNREAFQLDANGQPGAKVSANAYDPRQRPWYQQAKQAQAFTWSPVYQFAEGGVLGITPAQPIYDAQGMFKGVLGIDVSLQSISDFMRQLEISPSGEAFILEPSGALVASSLDESTVIEVDGEPRRVGVTESRNPLIRSLGEALLAQVGSLDAIQTNQHFTVKVNGVQHYVGVAPLNGGQGIHWLLLVAIPETDFRSILLASVYSTLVTGLLVAGVASALGVLAAGWITRPISRLTHAARAIEQERFSPNAIASVTARPDELGQLARIIQDMAVVISSRQQGLKQQLADLQQTNSRAQQIAQSARVSETVNWQGLLQRAQALRSQLSKTVNAPVLHELEPMLRDLVLSNGEWRSYAANDPVYQTGDAAHELFWVVQGAIALTCPHLPDTSITLTAGEFLGEVELLQQIPRGSAAQAVLPSQVWVLSAEGLRQVLQQSPQRDRLFAALDAPDSLAHHEMLLHALVDTDRPYREWLHYHLTALSPSIR